MLPVRRWPVFLLKVLRTIVAPQRWAVRAELRCEKLMSVCRRMHDAAKQREIAENERWSAVAVAHANEKRTERETHQQTVDNLRKIEAALLETLASERRSSAAEKERHAETRQQLAILEGEKLVSARQMELQENVIQKYLEIEAAEARNYAAKYQGRSPPEDTIL